MMYKGKKVLLRSLKYDDLPVILQHWNNYEIRKFLMNVFPVSEVSEKKWLEKAMTVDPTKDGVIIMGIEELENHQLIGTTSLEHILWPDRTAEFGIAIFNAEYLGKGFGTDAAITILRFGFEELGLKSVMLRVMSYNKRAIKAYEKVGFKHAGVLRKAVYRAGEFYDVIIMDILDTEFFEKHGKSKSLMES